MLSLEKILKQKGYSQTRTRTVVFQALSNSESLSMSQLINACKTEVDRATAYRVVELFEKLGIARRVQLGWKYRIELSDLFRPHHHHIECIGCGRVEELKEDLSLEKSINQAASAVGFVAKEHHLEVKGLCLACQKTIGRPRN